MDFITKPEYERFTAADREKRLQWFKEARFGMFIHYSLFSQHETGEWCMYQQDYTKAEYEEFAKAFSPKEGCADEWCAYRTLFIAYGLASSRWLALRFRP